MNEIELSDKSDVSTPACASSIQLPASSKQHPASSPHSPRLGLALSGGGARGLAHIGVLEVFEREGLPIDLLAGTSIGAVVAAGYACGLSACELEEEALRMSQPRQLITLIDRTIPRQGLLEGQKVLDYLSGVLGPFTFDDLRVPLAVVAVDLNSQKKVALRSGSVLEAVRASIALPGLFAPVKRGDQLLVDGGVLDNLPVDVVREMGADVVVGVDVSADADTVALLSDRLAHSRLVPAGLVEAAHVLWLSLIIMMNEINKRCLERAGVDLLIRPSIPPEVTVLSGFGNAEEIISAGKQAAWAALPNLETLCEQRRK